MSAKAAAAMLAAVRSGPPGAGAAGARGVGPWLAAAHVRAGEAAWELGGAPRRRPTALVCGGFARASRAPRRGLPLLHRAPRRDHRRACGRRLRVAQASPAPRRRCPRPRPCAARAHDARAAQPFSKSDGGGAAPAPANGGRAEAGRDRGGAGGGAQPEAAGSGGRGAGVAAAADGKGAGAPDGGGALDVKDAVQLGVDGVAMHTDDGGGAAQPTGKLRNARSGVLIAVLAALSVNVGKVCQKRGTQDLPLLQFKASVGGARVPPPPPPPGPCVHPHTHARARTHTHTHTHVLTSYVTNGWWVLGVALDVSGALMTMVSLSLAPVSVVQPVLGCGLAFVALFSVCTRAHT